MAASITRTCATPSETATRPLPRGDRDRPSRRWPAHITHFYHRQSFPAVRPMLALVDDARAEGLDVTFDGYPYEWASTRLLIMIPPWRRPAGRSRRRSASPMRQRRADPR